MPVNRLGFGAMRITGEGIWGWPEDRGSAIALLRRVVELGVNFIDTADAYGPDTSELLIAEALHPYADGLVIATKGGLERGGPGSWTPACEPERIVVCCEDSLRRLQVDRIDLYQLHAVDPKVSIIESARALAALVRDGKVRHVGLSNVTVEEIEAVRKLVPVATVQNRYNVADRHNEGVLEHCEREGIGFIPWFPLAAGSLVEPGGVVAEIAAAHGVTAAQVSLAWLLQRSPIMLPIPGTSSIAHLEQNLDAAQLRLTPADLAQLEEVARLPVL